MFEPTPTWPNFDFGQLVIFIEANNDQIWLPRGEASDFEQCLNRLQLDLISRFLHMNWVKYARFVILSNVWTDSQLTYFYLFATYEFG